MEASAAAAVGALVASGLLDFPLLPTVAAITQANAAAFAAACVALRARSRDGRISAAPREKRKERSQEWWRRTVPAMNDEQFHDNFRLSRAHFADLVALLSEGDSLPRRLRLLGAHAATAILLYHLGSRATLRETANQFGLSDAKVHETLELMTAQVDRRLSKLIRTPTTAAEWVEIAHRWATAGNLRIPFSCGALDCTHIPLWHPSLPDMARRGYFNRKGETSYNVQALVDDRLLFRSVYVGPPGSVNDATVLQQSVLARVARLVSRHTAPQEQP